MARYRSHLCEERVFMKVLFRRSLLLWLVFAMIGFVPAGAMENLDQMIEQTRALREKFLKDRHRPLYHFVSPEGVCHPFDPNGSIFWKGQYHLMYIFQHRKKHYWGHAVSKDMLHWRILLAWVGEALLAPRLKENGWAGVMSMPRVLSLAKDGTLRVKPIKEIELLRINPRVHKDISLADGAEIVLKDIAGDCLEIEMEIDPGSASQVGLRVRRSPQGEEETVIAYEPGSSKLILDVAKSSLDKDVRYGTHRPHTAEGGDDVRVQKAPFEVPPGETFKLRVFLDRSIIEVYGDDRQCVTQRIYPSRKDSLGVSLFCKGGSAKVLSLKAWDMAAANPW